MFRNGLLLSTAMTAVTLLLSGASTRAYAQTDMHVASRDPNARFLCTYGQFLVSAFTQNLNYSSGYASAWQNVAVPITGHGQTVGRIRVIEAQGPRTHYNGFTVGIYSNAASGLPGNPIAVGTGSIGPSCGPVKVPIPRTTLKSNTKYWIEERTSTPRCGRDHSNCTSSARLYWEADPNIKRKAYVQYQWRFSSSGHLNSSSTSPWMKQQTGPYIKLE